MKNSGTKKIYFMGVCGTAMGNAALLARASGHSVLGADTGVYPPMSTVLAEAGIELHEGYDPERLKRLAPDLVVVGNAMSRGNPEVEWLLDTRAIPFVSLPALLNETILRHRRNIVVCGTHGKTTTTALSAFLLRANGRDPGFLIGGVPQDPPEGSHLGAATDPFVIEGDEYDSAFFDKRSKFIHYAPTVAVLNNLEFDHADIFRDIIDVQRTFNHLSRIVPRSGAIVMNGDDDGLRPIAGCTWTRVVRVGIGADNDCRIEEFREDTQGSTFRLTWRGQPWMTVRWSLPGLFNARNAAMAAVAVGIILSTATGGAETIDPRGVDLSALAKFRGVRRRQDVRLHTAAVTVIEDFGHHPTAIAETLHSLRARYPGYRVSAAFEPRSNTARVKTLQGAFMRALGVADEVYLGPVHRPEKIDPSDRFDVEAVVQQLETQGTTAFAFASNAALFEKLVKETLPAQATSPRLVVFFSNGSFDGIIGRYVEAAR